MSNRDLLLEIGIEEMPARFVLNAINNLGKQVENWLQENKITFGEIQLFSTPRRLAILIRAVAESQQDIEEEAKGPARKIAQDADGNWSKAALGFARSQGASVEDIFYKEIKGVEYAHISKFIKGKKSIELLSELGDIVTHLHFPNNMRWGNLQIRYVRPIRWIVALFGNETIPFTVANITASNVSYGHRFLGNEIVLHDPKHYEEKLEEQFVIANYYRRKQLIVEQIKQIAESQQWDIPMDEELLEEVTNLVEYPTAFFGTFNQEFLHLPEEVLVTSMKEHQRYFPVKNKQGELLPYFIGVRNGNNHHLDTVVKGNEKVLRARLSDADFFYLEDQKIPIDQSLKKLENIIYHEKLGTLSEKVSRTVQIASILGKMVDLSELEQEKAVKAAEISKFDLVSNMVNEFPELQGVMGEKYALQQGVDRDIALAIKEHYQPQHADDEIPSSNIGAIVSLADKLDSIVSSFAIGLIPTGSQDPYALRRQATGVIRMLLEFDWNISLEHVLQEIIAIEKAEEDAELYNHLEVFFKLRLKYLLEEKGIRHDIIEAVLAGSFNGVPDIVNRAITLQNRSNDTQFKGIIESLSRVLNIASKAETDEDIDTSIFENDYELNLYNAWQQLAEINTKTNSSEERFEKLASLQPAISSYFDNTMVMAKEEKLRKNRLAQMKKLSDLIGAYAAMNEIIVK
ncbi:glycine--tRNA ligase subunit beta [Lederbergia graminis]|uniref:Glycine--tRNA ligase beta subunit n=1 Tax=Lederbergia graminis TaxID=735518 RepID=A0ABW0LPV0_9BACI